MNSADFAVSTDALISAFVILIYLPLGLASYRWLIPRLSSTSRLLASAFLVAQVLVMLLSLVLEPPSAFERWLWDFHEEWNIPATVASIQLAVVGGVALLTAWLAKARPAWQRWYFVGLSVVFLFLGLDEYLALHEYITGWEARYIALGAVVVAATLIVAARSPRRDWIWHFCLLAGLAISVAGAMLFNAIPTTCDSLGFIRLDGCLQFYFPEEALELLGIWLTLVAVLGHFTHAAPAPTRLMRPLVLMLPALWFLVLLLNSLIPGQEVRTRAEPAHVAFEPGITLRGYRVDGDGGQYILQIFTTGKHHEYIGRGLSIHLVDQVTGDSVARHDNWADRQHGFWLFGPDYAPIFRQRMPVNLAPDAPANRALWIIFSLWRKKGGQYIRHEILESDHRLYSEKQVILGELVLPAPTSPAISDPLAKFAGGFALDSVDMPITASPGETLPIAFTWRSDADSSDDLAQFLHFGHIESGEWFVYDQQPLGARLPTRLWYSGLAESETWNVPLPPDLERGVYEVYTGLYRLDDQLRIPARDADGNSWADARVALGSLIVE